MSEASKKARVYSERAERRALADLDHAETMVEHWEEKMMNAARLYAKWRKRARSVRRRLAEIETLKRRPAAGRPIRAIALE